MIEIRPCRGFDELEACVNLQVEVWGYCEGDVIPRRVFLVAQKIGGQVIGAFDVEEPGTGSRDNLVGFAFSLPGVKTVSAASDGSWAKPESYLHSHMLAVKEGYRNLGIGARLKLAQRVEALARGFRLMEWTFDPLEIKNAFLNIHKLGAQVRRYEENFYGVSSSRLQGGLPTDRLVAEWWIDSARVKAAITGNGSEESAVASQALRVQSDPEMQQILVPAEIYSWKSDSQFRHLAEELQAGNRHKFQEAFASGLAVTGFSRDERGNGIYRLSEWNQPCSQ